MTIDIRKILFGAAVAASSFLCDAAEADSLKTKTQTNYMPQIHGVMRSRFEQLTTGSKEGRFMVANARVNLRGEVAPFASYYFQVDFCNKGCVKIMDAYATLRSESGLKVMAGQMRIPFSVDASKAVEDYLFTNHSFVGTYIGNFRGVGAKLGWNARFAPWYVEGGMFNSAAMSNHDVWQKQYTFAIKSRYTVGNCFFEGAFESRYPDGIRVNMWDAAFSWSAGRWYTEAEYAYKHYTNKAAKACHAYNFMADYRIPITTEWFNQMSLQGRFDGATDHCSGSRDDDGRIFVDHSGRKRATGGITFSHLGQKLGCDLRLNYEQYFYDGDHIPQSGEDNTISVELVVWF